MYPVKRTWKPINSGRLYELYLEVMANARALKLWDETKENPPLYTRKSVRTLGTCSSNKNRNGTWDSSIILNQELEKYSDDQIRPIIVHEVAHAIYPEEHHGFYWRYTANRLGQKWGCKAEVYSSNEEINKALEELKTAVSPYKYELYCPCCGATWKYKCLCQAVKNPQIYLCKKDRTKLLSRKII